MNIRPQAMAMSLLLGALPAFGGAMPTVAGTWSAIDKETAALAEAIKTGKLAEVHHHAFAIRDLVRALPARSAAAKANARFVDVLATRLDEAGDANDKAATESSFQKLQGVLKDIRAEHE